MSTHSPIILEFEGTKRDCKILRTLEGVQEAIQANFPVLSRHMQQISLRYTDDEGDDITVTTTDELEEAFNVALPNGTLNLRILLPSDIQLDQIKHDITPQNIHVSPERSESCDSESNATSVLNILQEASSTAIAEIQRAMATTTDELNGLFSQLNKAKTEQASTSSKLKSTEMEVELLKHQVTNLEMHSNNLASQVDVLTQELSEASLQSTSHVAALKEKDDEIKHLRSKLAECLSWEAKYKNVEAERDDALSNLQVIRTGLLGLTSNPPRDVHVDEKVKSAEVVSTMNIASPRVSNVRPPPPYNSHDSDGEPSNPQPLSLLSSVVETSTTVSPLSEVTEKTEHNCEIEKQLKQLSELGKPMSKSEFETRLQAVGGDFRVLVSSLFS
jgi:hypothetical protein